MNSTSCFIYCYSHVSRPGLFNPRLTYLLSDLDEFQEMPGHELINPRHTTRDKELESEIRGAGYSKVRGWETERQEGQEANEA